MMFSSLIPAWTNVMAAIFGPAAIAVLASRLSASAPFLLVHVISVVAIAALVAVTYAIALRHEGLPIDRLGFARVSLMTPFLALALTLFFVLIFGPLAYWALAQLGPAGFESGTAVTNKLPIGWLIATIVIVAASEELLYRSYALERLKDLTGSTVAAGLISTLAFGLAHVPTWGLAAAATTLVSGGIMTLVYFWRRDVVALIVAHVATDLYGLVIAPGLLLSSGGG